jgi:uncharacterized phage-like protein YoqJ
MILAGTGHRPNKLGGYSTEAFGKLINIAKEYLSSNKPDLIISGMAIGWDQALAVAAIELDIPFDAYVPFIGQEAMWPKHVKEYYKQLLSKARVVNYISDGGYTGLKMQLRNEAMVNDCDRILAMWDGSSGGTANCIKYAETKQRPIINLYNKYIDI